MSLFNTPISAEKAARLLSVLGISRDDHVIDAGCGTGEFLIRLIETTGASGLGIDLDATSIATARQSAATRIVDAEVAFREADIKTETLADGSFDLAMCIGSTHAFGTGDSAYPNTIEALSRLVRPGGQLLLGEGYWKQPPAPEYLQLIGEPVGIYRDHLENVSFAEQCGLVPIYSAVSNDDEWDHFEWSHRMRIERQAARHPDDQEIVEKARRSRAWRDGYLRWGRTTMGFGFYLFQRPAAAASGAT